MSNKLINHIDIVSASINNSFDGRTKNLLSTGVDEITCNRLNVVNDETSIIEMKSTRGGNSISCDNNSCMVITASDNPSNGCIMMLIGGNMNSIINDHDKEQTPGTMCLYAENKFYFNNKIGINEPNPDAELHVDGNIKNNNFQPNTVLFSDSNKNIVSSQNLVNYMESGSIKINNTYEEDITIDIIPTNPITQIPTIFLYTIQNNYETKMEARLQNMNTNSNLIKIKVINAQYGYINWMITYPNQFYEYDPSN